MIIECAHCHARYQYDETRFEGKPAKRIRCAKCQQIFEIRNPRPTAATPSPAPSPARAATPSSVPAAARKDDLDLTMTAKRLKTREEPMPEPPVTTPVEVSRQDSMPRLPSGKRLSLAVIDGPDAGKVFRIEKPRVVIGRSGADVVLNDGEASRAHAAVEVRDAVTMLQDLGSTNGTLVEGQKIDGQVEIQNQSEFQVGSSTLMLIVTESE